MLGWLAVVAAGILNGTFAVPMKTARRWSFDQIWGAFSVLAMAVLPWLAVWIANPRGSPVVSRVPAAGLIQLISLGLLWGAASLLYGMAVDALGVSLGISIQLGLSIVVGALVPRVWQHATTSSGGSAPAFYMGLLLMVAGVIACAGAGRGDHSEVAEPKDRSRFRRGLVIAIAGGLGAPLLNVGIQYGQTLFSSDRPDAGSGKAVAWAVFLAAASVTQGGYCVVRIFRRRALGEYFQAAASGEWLRVIAMAILWAASIFLYAIGATALGPLGTSVGWPILIGLIVVTSNSWGVALGEWKKAPSRRFRQMLAGSSLLVFAAFLVARGR